MPDPGLLGRAGLWTLERVAGHRKDIGRMQVRRDHCTLPLMFVWILSKISPDPRQSVVGHFVARDSLEAQEGQNGLTLGADM